MDHRTKTGFTGSQGGRVIAESRGFNDHSRDLDYSIDMDANDSVTAKIIHKSSSISRSGTIGHEIKKLFKKL